MSFESSVRDGWNIEKLIGIYGSEPDEDGVISNEETKKFLKSLNSIYKISRIFNFRRRA